MKKNHLFGMFAMAAFAFASCSQDEVVTQSPQVNKAIEFGTYVGRDAVSRAHVIGVDKLAEEGFGVFAYYTGQNTIAEALATATPNFMYNQKVHSTEGSEGATNNGVVSWNGTWKYDPLKYWPNNVDDKVSFYAYAPYDIGQNGNFVLPSSDSKGKPSLVFKVGTDVEKHQDLLYASPAEDKSKNSSSPVNVGDKINFDFQHALARIGFKAEVMVDYVNGDGTGNADDDKTTSNGALDQYTTITINSVKLIGKFYTQGVMKLEDGTWPTNSLETPTEDVTFELNSTSTSDFATRTTPNNIFKTNDIEIRQLNNDENYIMIIPQNFTETGANAPGNLKMIVEYEVFTDLDRDGVEDANDSKITNKITSDNFALNFEQGKAYSLNIHIGMTSVKFSATVQNWDPVNGTDYVVNVPINTETPAPTPTSGGGDTGGGT